MTEMDMIIGTTCTVDEGHHPAAFVTKTIKYLAAINKTSTNMLIDTARSYGGFSAPIQWLFCRIVFNGKLSGRKRIPVHKEGNSVPTGEKRPSIGVAQSAAKNYFPTLCCDFLFILYCTQNPRGNASYASKTLVK
jgi:hypothetical protein